jgi:hypothetical protein
MTTRSLTKSLFSTAALLGLSATLAAGSAEAAPVLLAGFNNAGVDTGRTGSTTISANEAFTGINAEFFGEARGTNFGSGDGFYGGTSFVAPSFDAGDYSFRANVANTFTITNNTGGVITLDQVSFDVHECDNANDDIELVYVSGDLAGVTNGTVINTVDGINVTETRNGGDYADFDWSLAALADQTLADGESAVFSLKSVTLSSSLTSLDNIGFIGSVVPEPGSLALLGLGGLLIARRRRG